MRVHLESPVSNGFFLFSWWERRAGLALQPWPLRTRCADQADLILVALLCLQSAGMTGVHHHIQLKHILSNHVGIEWLLSKNIGVLTV